MMKTLLMILVLLSSVCVTVSNAQECIVVQNGEDMTICYESCLEEAFNDALDGATIYISEGNFSFCDEATVVDKKPTVIRAGVYTVQLRQRISKLQHKSQDENRSKKQIAYKNNQTSIYMEEL